MYAWEAIQNAINYIEDKLSEEIKMETLSRVSSLSPYYFQRLFKRLVKTSVNEYVKLRRLAKASEVLKDKSKRILDVALDFGFSSHSSFSRSFKEVYGITPEEYRSRPVILSQFIKPDLLLKHITVEEDVPLISDGIVIEVTRRKLKENRTFIGISGEVPITELTEGKVTGIATTGVIWDDFHHRKATMPHLLQNSNELGAIYMDDVREGCCTYFAGAEVIGNVSLDEYVSYTLPCGDYIVCCFEAENFDKLTGSAIFKASSFMNKWMRKHNLVCGGFTAEMYYNTDPDACYMEIWLPLNSSQRDMRIQETFDITNGSKIPSFDSIRNYVNSPLWDKLCSYIETEYQSKPVLEFSKCSMQFGWNVKYKKAGRTLCTLYPMEGYYIALVVIGERERMETEWLLPIFTEYLQQLYHNTKTGMGQRWLMINVVDEAVLEDVKQCIAIRRGLKKK